MVSSTSTLLGFFRFATVPLGSDDQRAFFQQRLALFAKLLFVLTIFPFLITPPLLVFFRKESMDIFFRPYRLINVAITLVSLAIWQICRKGTRSLDLLYALDAGGMFFLGAGPALMILWIAPHYRPELVIMQAITYILVGRAALIPSTPLRTFLISLKVALPLVPMTYIVHSLKGESTAVVSPGFATVLIAFWCSVAIAATTVLSQVIYGLQQRVREAMKLGQYTLEEKIGEGGMGAVYKASHAMLRRPTAVKLLPADKAGATTIARFEREVQLTSRLTHPNTVAIFDFGRTPDNIFYYAMEYLEGLTLEELVGHGGPVAPGRGIHILEQVAGALAEAHEKGIVHRDVKPANIILCERGGQPDVAKVVDFGLVKELGAQESTMLSNVNTITGTPLYLSPEAIKAADTVGPKSDLYALGAVGYFLLTGVHAFDAPTLVEVCSHHLHTRPTPPAERLGRAVPADLEAIVYACLEKDPARRPASAESVHDALLACADAGQWTTPRARQWWREHEEMVVSLRSGKGGALPSPGFQTTIAVDLRERMVDAADLQS